MTTCVTGEHTDPCEVFNLLQHQVIAQISGTTPAVKSGDSGGPVFSDAPNTARGVIHGQILGFLGGDTDKFVYGQIGYLFDGTSHDGSEPGLRVLTKPGPGGGSP